MSDERREVLRMLEDGTINAEEADMLIRAISDSSEAGSQGSAKHRKSKEVAEIFQEIRQEIKQGVNKAVESVHRTADVGKVVGGAVGDVVDQVKTSVSDAINAIEKTSGKRKFEERIQWKFDSTEVSAIAAQTVNGSISLDGAEVNHVAVTAIKEVRAPSAEEAEEFAQSVQVHAELNDSEIRIYRDYPNPPKGVNVTVSYEIQTPHQMGANLTTVNNAIRVSGIEGAIAAKTVNGTIKVQGDKGPIGINTTNGNIETSIGQLAESAEFSTTNGSIDVKISDGAAPIGAQTTNGSIHLTLPANFAGQLNAKTSNGSVKSDLPTVHAVKQYNRLEGQIGEGGDSTVKLRSANGSIHLSAHPQ